MRPLSFPLSLLLLALTGCIGTSFDAEQARLCRLTLPALYDDGADIRPIREATGTAPGSIRIDYRIAEPEQPARVAHTTCIFSGSGVESGRFELISVATDGVALSDVKLYILKRWWLEEPGAAEGRALQPIMDSRGLTLTTSAAYILQQAINAAPLSAVYALLAVAYSLVYGLAGRIVLGFGEITVFGSYGVLLGVGLAAMLGLVAPPPALLMGLLAGIAMSCGLGCLVGKTVVSRLGEQAGQSMIVATLGIAIAIQEFLRLTQGANDKWLPPLAGQPIVLATSPEDFITTVTPMQMLIAGMAMCISMLTVNHMRASAFGRQWRAVADDPGAAALFGIDSTRVLVRTMALGGALAGLAGWILLVHYGGIGFSNGLMIGLKALVAAVLGGIGSVGGALMGGVILGLAETLWSGYFDLAWRDVVILGALALLLAVRPGGLFGYAELGPRRV